MAKGKKLEKVVVEEETTPTAGVMTEVTEAEGTSAEQSAEQSAEVKAPVEGVTELNAAEEQTVEQTVEQSVEQPAEKGEGEGEGEMDPEMAKELAEKEANAEKLLTGHTEVLKTEPVANGRGIPSQVITDPLGRKTTIYQPQTATKNFSNGCKTINGRRGEILSRNDVNKGNH